MFCSGAESSNNRSRKHARKNTETFSRFMTHHKTSSRISSNGCYSDNAVCIRAVNTSGWPHWAHADNPIPSSSMVGSLQLNYIYILLYKCFWSTFFSDQMLSKIREARVFICSQKNHWNYTANFFNGEKRFSVESPFGSKYNCPGLNL